MYRTAQLKLLAETYLAATGASQYTLSQAISRGSNNRLIGRLLAGKGVGLASVEAASDFFDERWPADTVWPREVVRNGASKRVNVKG